MRIRYSNRKLFSPPFEADLPQETYKRIAKVDLMFPDQISQLARDFVAKLLMADPNARMSLSEALVHPWILLHNPTANATSQPAPSIVPKQDSMDVELGN